MACPLWPLHLIFIYIMAMCPLWLMFSGVAAAVGNATWWNVTFDPDTVQLVEENHQTVRFWTYEPLGPEFHDGWVEISVSDSYIAALKSDTCSDQNSSECSVAKNENICDGDATKFIYLNTSSELTSLPLNLSFTLTGRFLGYARVRVQATSGSSEKPLTLTHKDPLSVSVIRAHRLVDKVFIWSVAIMMGLNYINMGCSLDLEVVKKTLKFPVGPAVGLLSQYIFMPLCSFGLAYLFFEQPDLRLGLFTSGCSPGGGASNMWTFLLGGNLNLSITMTFFSNIFAFATMPFWIFTLGRVIFQESKITIPYSNIVIYVIGLVVPVGIGVLLQIYLPKVADVSRRILKPFSIAMILFIVVFGIYTNLFMIQVFTWQIFCAGFAVPLLGYLFGAAAARLLRFAGPDITAISVETGVQNTGVAIVMLRLTLPQPAADLTTVIPVALATMTPIPLLVVIVVQKVRQYWNKNNSRKYTLAPTSSPTPSDEEAGKPTAVQDGANGIEGKSPESSNSMTSQNGLLQP